MKHRALKIVCLNLGIVLLNVILFSPSLVGLNFVGEAFKIAMAVTVIVMSLIAFCYGNYVLLFQEKPAEEPMLHFLKGNEFTKPEDYAEALKAKKAKAYLTKKLTTPLSRWAE